MIKIITIFCIICSFIIILNAKKIGHFFKIVDIANYNPEILDIFSREVLKMIAEGKKGWEEMLPKGIAEQIKEKRLFSYTKSNHA